jgi:hypothetical protein
MRRTALRAFFERVVVASLPLTVACGDPTMNDMGQTAPPADLTAVAPADLTVGGPPDLAVLTDLALGGGDLDTCETQHPITYVNIPTSDVPDSGHFNTLCVNGDPCTQVCPSGYTQCCSPHPSDGGALAVSCVYYCGPAGRRPAGLAETSHDDGCAVGRYLASMAHLEAASVHAFRSLERDLRMHAAPAQLIADARRAARDEVRHARLMRRLAAAHGARPPRVTARSYASRSLEAIAVENAVEGCVRETYGALLATWQARVATEAPVRAAMAAVAGDETRHAQLAWDVDAWTRRRLDRASRRRVVDARRRAVDELEAELAAPPPDELVRRFGVPDVAQSRRLHGQLRRELWA